MLLEAGHSIDSILDDYSVEEIEVYYEAELRAQARRMKSLTSAVRMATNADRRAIKSFMEKLDKTAEEIDKVAGRHKQSMESLFGALDSLAVKPRRRKDGHNRGIPDLPEHRPEQRS